MNWLNNMIDDPTRGDPALPAMVEQVQRGWRRGSGEAAMVFADWLDEHGDATRASCLRRGWYPVLVGGILLYLLPPTDPPKSAEDAKDRRDALAAHLVARRAAGKEPSEEPKVTYRSS